MLPKLKVPGGRNMYLYLANIGGPKNKSSRDVWTSVALMKGRDYCVTLPWRNIDSFEAGDTSSDKEYIMTFLELWTSNLVDCSQSFWSNPQGNRLITGNAEGGKICKTRPCWISLGLCWIRSWSFPGTWHLKKLGRKNLTFQNNIKVFLEVKLSK